MTRNTWHMTQDGDRLTLARCRRTRMDFCIETRFPDLSRHRLAQQIRQDIWRALQALRGFSPIVEVSRDADGLIVRAGGQVDGALPRSLVEHRLTDLLHDTERRARWARFAAHKRAA